MTKIEKKLNFFEKKSFGFGKKSFGSDTDTEIGPWFRFTIPKPGVGRTLLQVVHSYICRKGTRYYYCTYYIRDHPLLRQHIFGPFLTHPPTTH